MTRNSGVSTAPIASGPKMRMPSTKPKMLRSHQRSNVSRFIRFLIGANGSFVIERQKQVIAGVNQFNGAVLRADQITRRAGRRAALRGNVNAAVTAIGCRRRRKLTAIGGGGNAGPGGGRCTVALRPRRAEIGGSENVA